MSNVLVIASLFDEPPIIVERPLTAEERFLKFHSENVGVYVELRKLALELVEAGHDHFAVATIYEVLRWRHFMRTKDDSGWKLNNSYRSRYARMLAENEPRLANVFEMRRLHDGSER